MIDKTHLEKHILKVQTHFIAKSPTDYLTIIVISAARKFSRFNKELIWYSRIYISISLSQHYYSYLYIALSWSIGPLPFIDKIVTRNHHRNLGVVGAT